MGVEPRQIPMVEKLKRICVRAFDERKFPLYDCCVERNISKYTLLNLIEVQYHKANWGRFKGMIDSRRRSKYHSSVYVQRTPSWKWCDKPQVLKYLMPIFEKWDVEMDSIHVEGDQIVTSAKMCNDEVNRDTDDLIERDDIGRLKRIRRIMRSAGQLRIAKLKELYKFKRMAVAKQKILIRMAKVGYKSMMEEMETTHLIKGFEACSQNMDLAFSKILSMIPMGMIFREFQEKYDH